MTTPLDVFNLIREELLILQALTGLLTASCELSTSLERKVPRDPYSCIPVKRELHCPIRTHYVCFEQTDFDRLSHSLRVAQDLLEAFSLNGQ